MHAIMGARSAEFTMYLIEARIQSSSHQKRPWNWKVAIKSRGAVMSESEQRPEETLCARICRQQLFLYQQLYTDVHSSTPYICYTSLDGLSVYQLY
jgi:hypothetical protein